MRFEDARAIVSRSAEPGTPAKGTSLEQAIDGASSDERVRLAMRVGAVLEGGSLTGGWGVGDNGQSFGPYQIHMPAHPGVSPDQAVDPVFATNYMVDSYARAVEQVPAQLWESNPALAAGIAAYYAERPASFYGGERVANAYQAATGRIAPPNTGSFGGLPGSGGPTVNREGGEDDGGLPLPGLDLGGGSRYINVGNGLLFDTSTGETVDAYGPYRQQEQQGGNPIQDIYWQSVMNQLDANAPMTRYQRASLGQSAQNSAFSRALNYIGAIQDERGAADTRKRNYVSELLAAGPSLAGGRDHYGGFGPYGGGTLLEMMQGGLGQTIDTAPGLMQLPVEEPRGPDYSMITSMLGPLR